MQNNSDYWQKKYEREISNLDTKMENRLDQIMNSIDKMDNKMDTRDYNQRNFTIFMFAISIIISILGAWMLLVQ